MMITRQSSLDSQYNDLLSETSGSSTRSVRSGEIPLRLLRPRDAQPMVTTTASSGRMVPTLMSIYNELFLTV